MALTNSQYDAVMRRYDEIRETNRREAEGRLAEVYRRIPRYRELDDEVSTLSFEAAKRRITDPASDLSSYHARLAEIGGEKKALLLAAGLPEDYTEMRWNCPLCRDTGYIGTRPCTCFEKASADLIYGMSGLAGIAEDEDFGHFSFRFYSDTILDEASGRTPLELAKSAFETAKAFTGRIGEKDANLCIYGSTGVGKTFLTHCIAKEALSAGYQVICISAGELFERLADSAFRRSDGDAGRGMISGADLLIIDDLGTELTNAFTASELFRLINERARDRRSTVISTNLSLQQLKEQYSERIISRIMSRYTMVRMAGEDIRILKVLNS